MGKGDKLARPPHAELGVIPWQVLGLPSAYARVLSISRGTITAPCALQLGARAAAAEDAASLEDRAKDQAMPSG
jgi:hypothetical protein